MEALLYNALSLIQKVMFKFSPLRKIPASQPSPSPVPEQSRVKRTVANLCLLLAPKEVYKNVWEAKLRMKFFSDTPLPLGGDWCMWCKTLSCIKQSCVGSSRGGAQILRVLS